MRWRHFTFIVAHPACAKLHKIRIPSSLLYSFALICLLSLLSLGVAVWHYGQLLVKVADYRKLLEENRAFKRENERYKLMLSQLDDRISSLELMSRKLSLLSAFNHLTSGIGGTGGAYRDIAARASSREAVPDPPLASARRRVSDLEARYLSLAEQFYRAAYKPTIWPVKGYASEAFGSRIHPISGDSDYHSGIDISAPYGNQVIAPAAGTVIFAGPRQGYGNLVILDHRFGITTLYGHLSRIAVKVGQTVERYDVIGYVGSTGKSTGPHLHYEIRIDGRPVNPLKFIGGGKGS